MAVTVTRRDLRIITAAATAGALVGIAVWRAVEAIDDALRGMAA